MIDRRLEIEAASFNRNAMKVIASLNSISHNTAILTAFTPP
jgi:hypothetical protein